MRGRTLGCALAVLVVASSGCSAGPSWEPRRIEVAYLEQGAQTIMLDAGICGEMTSTDLSRADGLLAVDLRVRGDHQGDCNDLVVISLEQPYEEDAIVDANFGHTVMVRTE